MRTRLELEMIKREGKPLSMKKLTRQMLDKFGSECVDGDYAVIIRRKSQNKSNKQLGAYFGLMIKDAIVQANDMGLDTSGFLKEMVKGDIPSGVGLTSDFLKELFYCLCPIYSDGKRITLSKATMAEAAEHFTRCRNLLAAHGIYINEPDSEWKDKV